VVGKQQVAQTTQPTHLFPHTDPTRQKPELRQQSKPMALQLTDNKENYEQSPMVKERYKQTESPDIVQNLRAENNMVFKTPNAMDNLVKDNDCQLQLAQPFGNYTNQKVFAKQGIFSEPQGYIHALRHCASFSESTT